MTEEDLLNSIKEFINDADIAWEQRKIEDVIRYYDLAYNIIPEPKMNYPITLTIMGLKADKIFKWRRYAEALEIIEKCQQHSLGKDNPFILLREGQCNLELGKLKKAYSIFQEVLKLQGKEIFLHDDPKYLYFALKNIIPTGRVNIKKLIESSK